MASEARNKLIDRMLGAARLNKETYEEVEADTSATRQALLVVTIVAIATGIGSIGSGGIGGFIGGMAAGLVGWALWAWITYFIGTRLLKTPETHANWGQLARTLGFAQSPGVLKVFAFIPVIGGLIYLAVLIWTLVTMVVAVRQALDYTSTGRAVGVVLLSFIPYAILQSIVISLIVRA